MKRIIILLCLAPLTVFSQSVTRNLLSVAGNSVTKGNINLSYSIGEVIIPTVITKDNVLTQGFQQPAIIKPENINDLFRDVKIQCYPNPVIDDLKIMLSDLNNNKTVVFRVFNTQGSEIERIKRYLNDKTSVALSIDCNELVNGLYFVHIYIDNYYAANFNFYKAQE